MLLNRRLLLTFGCLLLGFVLMSACGGPPAPTATPALVYVTITPATTTLVATGSTHLAAAEPAASLPSVTPTPTSSPTLSPTATSTPSATPTQTATAAPPTPTPTPHAVINSPYGLLNVRSGPGLIYDPPLGAFNNGTVVEVLGRQFSLEGELWWLVPFPAAVTGQGWIYAEDTIASNADNVPWIAPPPTPTGTPTPSPTTTPTVTPTFTPSVTPTPTLPVVVDWTIVGRVTQADTVQPIPGARVEAILGSDEVQLSTFTAANGDFSLNGRALDQGGLKLNLSAVGYRANTFIFTQTRPRDYELFNLQLWPVEECRYESVLEVPQASGISRLSGLGFTTVFTTPVDVAGDETLIGLILTQAPGPPLLKLDCTTPINLGVGYGPELSPN